MFDTNTQVDVFGLNCETKKFTKNQQALVDLINEQLSISKTTIGKNSLTNE